MSVATLAPEHMGDFMLGIYANRYQVDQSNPAAVAWLHNIKAGVNPTADMPTLGVDVAPFDGTEVVRWLAGNQEVRQATIHPFPAPTAQEPAKAATEAEAVVEEVVENAVVAWADLFVMLGLDTIQAHYADDVVLIARLLRYVTKQGDIALPIARLEAITGIKRRSLKKALTERINTTISIRETPDGRQDTYTDADGETWWRLNVHHTIGARHVQVPLTWLLTDPADGEPVATAYAPSTILAAIITRCWIGQQRAKARASMTQLASFGRVTRSKFAGWWGAAEDAGLVSASRDDFGGTAIRSSHAVPLINTTKGGRKESEKKERVEPVNDSLNHDPNDLPF